MIDKQYMITAIYNHISAQMKCSVTEIKSGNRVFINDESKSERYVQILSIGDTDIITASPDLYPKLVESMSDITRDELYESNYVMGQTIHYIPDLKQIQELPFTKEYSFELLMGDELCKLHGIEGFENSLAFDEKGYTPTCIVLYAKAGDEIIGLAGASYEDTDLREIGVDVKKEYRGRRLASLLVRNLTAEIIKQDKVPFYSASVTNIASQAVAFRSGYMPLWTDTFSVRNMEGFHGDCNGANRLYSE